MPDKKIVDDYYSQSLENKDSEIQSGEKKPKISIKRKIKIKKEIPKDIIEKKESIIQKSKKPKIEEKIKEKNVGVDLVSTQEEEKKQVFRKEYFTKKGLEKQPINQQEDKKEQKTDFKKNAGLGYQTKSFNNKKTSKFLENKEEQKTSKFFKKDKSNKYSKKIILEDDEFTFFRSSKIKNIKKEDKKMEDIKQKLTDRSGETVIIGDILSVKELSEKIGIPLMKLITEFMKNGMKVTLNSKIDFDTASIISDVFNIKLQKDISSGFGVKDMISGDISNLLTEDDKTLLINRAPIISIMGHVDHGKTSLLDYIRKTKVADKEAGGITQSIGAYQVEYNNEKITFLDTPGHEAFTIMRARGAKSTDIAILVVAADEGVKPQTIESINHANEANIPIIVAINKIDKQGANIDTVKGELAQQGLQPEDWGGKIPMIPISAKTGEGINNLLEIIILSSQLLELKANSNRFAVGTVLESHLDIKLGPIATVLINTGTLNKGDSIVCKGFYGKVKVLKDQYLKNITKAGPSKPVLVVGLDSVCEGGDIIQVVSNIEKARTKSLEYKELILSKKSITGSSLDSILLKIKSGNLKQLKIVVKADTNGSLEAIKGSLLKLSTPETSVEIIYSGVGNITQGDVLMSQSSGAILVGFNVVLLGNTNKIVNEFNIEYISSKIIYHITQRIEKIITGMLDPKEVEIILGEAKVAGIFYGDKGFMILGLKLESGSKIENKALVRIIKNNKLIGSGKIENLKSGIIDVQELEGPIECGIKLKSSIKVVEGDMLEIYKIEIQK